LCFGSPAFAMEKRLSGWKRELLRPHDRIAGLFARSEARAEPCLPLKFEQLAHARVKETKARMPQIQIFEPGIELNLPPLRITETQFYNTEFAQNTSAFSPCFYPLLGGFSPSSRMAICKSAQASFFWRGSRSR